jgi:ABC-type antimicrobial peptide transport system permease subunit
VLVTLLNLFISNLESNKQQLANISQTISINAQISNLNGTQQNGLVIQESVVDAILESKYIIYPAVSVVLSAGKGEFLKDNLQAHMTIDAAAVTSLEALNGITEFEISFTASNLSLILRKNTTPCIVEKGFLSENNWNIGQTVSLSLYYDYLDKDYQYTMQQLKTEKFFIAGSILSENGDYMPQVIVPFNWARNAFHEKKIPFLANAASFDLKDPRQINAFKKEMRDKLHMLELNPAGEFSYAGNALAVNDETFILSASRIRNNINMLTGFLPFILLIIIFIGYIISYLLIQNRRGQYATMRSLGMSRRMCFYTFFIESMFVEMTGGILGMLGSFLLTKQKITILSITFAFFLLCYIVGTTIALNQLGKLSVMKSLSQKD